MEGHTILSHENFDVIPDAEIGRLVTAKGQTVTTANLNRMRTTLELKYGSMVTERVAAVASEPGAWEKWISTGEGKFQAGTVVGEIARPLFMFKMFAMSVPRRMLAQGQNLGPGRALMSYATYMAGLIVAGYLSQLANNLLKGKEAPKWIADDGSLNYSTLKASLDKSGGFGFYGNILFGQYERYGQSIADNVGGPLYGNVVKGLDLGRKSVLPTEKERTDAQAEGLRLQWWKFVEGNAPFANIFYIKPALDHAIFWNIREMISPGTLHKSERQAERQGDRWYMRPSEVAPLPFEERMKALGSRPEKAIESLNR
jgi:hypothetical protein